MEDQDFIFQNGYNKIINILEDVDTKLSRRHSAVVSILSQEVLDKVAQLKDFSISSEKENVEMIVFCNKIVLDYTRYQNYLSVEMEVNRIYEEQAFPKINKKGEYVQEDPILLYRLALRNTPNRNNQVHTYFELVDGKYNFVNATVDPNVLDVEYNVYLEKINDKFYIKSVKSSYGLEVYTKRAEFSFDEIIDCIEDEDDYEEDLEIEFEADFDL